MEDPKPSAEPTNHNPNFSMNQSQCSPSMLDSAPIEKQEQDDRGSGIYAVVTNPYLGSVPGVPPTTLIPIRYNIPTRLNGAEGSSTEGQRRGLPDQNAQHRQLVVRRFQIGFQIDLLLILKLAAVVFVFKQDGSRERLLFLLLFASVIYLYQTGALTPVIRWFSQWVQQAITPPQPPVRAGEQQPPGAEGNGGGNDENRPNVNRMNWWGIAKEIQMFVVGFITSLLPGFQNE